MTVECPTDGILPEPNDLNAVLDCARSLGMIGVVIMAKQCTLCGDAHYFAVGTTISPEGVPELLTQHAEITRSHDPDHTDPLVRN